MGGPNPIWWREFPAGHALPLYQGRAPLPPRKERSFGDLGSERTKLEDLRKDVTDFLRLEPGARERRVLRALAEKELRRHMKGDLPELLKKLDAADDTAALAGELARMVSKGNAPEDHERAWALGAIFAKGGEAVTLAVLEKEQPGPAEWREEVLREVRARLKPGAAQVESEKPEEPPPATAEKLKEMRTWLQGKPTEEQIGELMWFLTAQDPGPLAEWLARWEPEADGPFGSDQGYGMASWFAWKCGSDRGANLKKLLAAKDPCVRVAGAVYLCYEDEAAGREALRACMKLEGDAGSWAALTLARRGDKDAMPRLFQALEPPQERRSGLLRGNLIQATQLLLSNVASAGGLPQAPALGPEVPGPQHAGDFERAERERADRFRKLREACEAWWKEHGAKAKLADPWLPLCAEKKID
jgi:hypothetical protein